MILITTQSFPPDRGGIEGLMSGLADALCAEGCDVTVLADQAAASEPPHPCAYQLRRFAGLKPWRRWRKAVAVRAAINAGGVTGVFADSWKSAEKLGALSVPVAVLAHGMEFPAHPSARKAARIRRVVGDADTVIANSSYTAGLVRPYLQGKTRLVVINPPIGPQPPAVDEQLAALRTRLGRKSPVLATVARLEPRKGVDMVIRALPAIRRTFPEVSYLVAGAGGDRERLENLASELGVSECVHFLGAVNDAQKAAVYALADLFVMPVRREGDSVEGFGIVYREANWYGLPVLAGRDGGAVDAVAEGETGALCNGADLSEVTAAILELLGNERERQTMALRAAEVARGPAQWKASVREFLAALEPST
ncbi:glycosyltransferase family 4 protein [Microbulbifer hydrolyticus]|uniref:Glycosyltransferase n=1 Tax=Microbulbifer hydrolyticus TaxID=48074 RepID=A0A6P1T8N2_9GAMM|nr:glycosyltransferase family 4 protein [Microbulbifer hydrolyticus]MBB5211131.1 phosphatidylinositol alpha-1,6-mannosyltransferase [Microbulbifer hydrolyticus]QHQ38085.1 glycosyltransferase [Microbulbifer hydrolyticus]